MLPAVEVLPGAKVILAYLAHSWSARIISDCVPAAGSFALSSAFTGVKT